MGGKMITKERLQEIAYIAGESMVQNGNLDENIAYSELRLSAIRLLTLLDMPNSRPIQERFDLLKAIVEVLE